MQLNQLTQNNKILARYRLLPTKSNDAVLDTNRSGEIETSPYANSSVYISEPVLNVDIKGLRDYAAFNKSGSVFTKDDLVDTSHYRGVWNGSKGRMHLKWMGSCEEISRELNPFTTPATGFAIDVGSEANSAPYFYILADKV